MYFINIFVQKHFLLFKLLYLV